MLAVPIIACGVLGVALYVYVLADDERWLIVAILCHLLLFLRTGPGGSGEVTPIGIPDIAFSVIFFPGLILWFVRRIRAREKFLVGWADVVVIVFLVYAFLSIAVSAYQGFSIEKGLREFLLFVPLLLIFPVRKEAEKEHGIRLMIWTLLVTSIGVGLVIIIRYKLDLMAAHYLWQVVGNRQQKEESLYMSGIIILFALLVSNRYSKPLVFFLLGLEMFSLAITFSRGYWITTILGLGASTFFIKGQARRRYLSVTFPGAAVSGYRADRPR